MNRCTYTCSQFHQERTLLYQQRFDLPHRHPTNKISLANHSYKKNRMEKTSACFFSLLFRLICRPDDHVIVLRLLDCKYVPFQQMLER